MVIDNKDIAVKINNKDVVVKKAKVVGFIDRKHQIAYLEGRVSGRACDIIDLILETQMATQSLVVNSQVIHDNLIAIQRLARDLLTPIGNPDGGEVSHGTA